MSTFQKIFVLGPGSMGSLIAHELAALPQNLAQVVLLFKNRRRLDEFVRQDSELQVNRPVGQWTRLEKSQVAAGCHPPVLKYGKRAMIDNLIISTKTYQTETALKPYVPHLHGKTNVLVMQNGMGMVRTLIEKFWPHDKGERPNFFQAVSTHGAFKSSPFVVNHVGAGLLSIAQVPAVENARLLDYTPKPPALIQRIVDCKNLNATHYNYNEFLLLQMEKLVVNACVNPLTALLDCLNGDLLSGSKVVPIMRRVIGEAVKVFKAEHTSLAELAQTESVLKEDRLLNTVFEVCKFTAENSSSMREDIRNLNTTEIDWINGYVIDLGVRHGISTPTNRMLSNLVKNKLSIERSLDHKIAYKTIGDFKY